MKGIFSIKTISKCLPSKNASNMGKALNTINFASFHSDNQTKPNSNHDTEKKRLLSEAKSEKKINFGFGNLSRKIQFSLSSLLCSYYYRLQVSNLNKYMKDLAVLKLSDDKNNLNGNNKNLNEEEVDFKLNESSKGNKNSNGNNNNNEDQNNNNNNNNSINYIKITLMGIVCYVFVNYLTELRKENNKILISLQEFMDKVGSNSIKKIGLVFHDDKTNKVNVYAVDKNDNTYKINEQFDKELFLQKIQENSNISSHLNSNASQQNSVLPNIVYEYTDDLKNRNLLFIGLLGLLLVAEKIIRQNNLTKTILNNSKSSLDKSKTKLSSEDANLSFDSISKAFEALKAKLGFTVKEAESTKATEKVSKIKFSDVAGLHNTKQEVKEFVEFLKHGDKYTELGARIPRGAIFTGPPGTGKTLLAKAIAGEADVNFYFKSGSEFQKMYVGEGAADLRKLFQTARDNAPSIIFIDEIDSIGKKRDSFRAQIRDDDGILNQLLVEMDGFSTDKNVIVFAATNRADMLDSALMRSGRFDRKIEFSNPNEEERAEILKLYLKNVKLDKPKEIDSYAKRLAELTSNFSGADLANMVNEAAIITARESKEAVDAVSFEKAFDRVYYGLEKKKPNSRTELNHISIYESAKVVCSWLLENVKPIIRVSILPKTKKKATVNEDKVLYTKEELFERITLCLSGRVAEQHYLGKSSTLSAEDLIIATRLAEKMMKNLGMSKLGNITAKNIGEKNLSIIDEEIREILHLASEKSKELIIKNSDKIMHLRDTLLKKESLDYEGLKEVLGPLPRDKEVEEEESEKQKISASI